MKRVFHYTIFQRYQSIFNDREIRVATKYVPEGVKPVVWFTTNPEWEETANKMAVLDDGSRKILNRQAMWEMNIYPIRIEIDPKMVSLRSWNHYKKNSGEPKESITKLLKAAGESNPKQWLVSYENVPIRAIIGVSSWDGTKWLPWPKVEKDSKHETHH
jgi:hypothetical protein